jgi:hypothetical protein
MRREWRLDALQEVQRQEARRGGRFVADWRVSRSVGLQIFLRSKHDLQEWARLCPLTLALSPNTRNVLGEREETMEMLTQGGTSGSYRCGRPGLPSDAPLGLY